MSKEKKIKVGCVVRYIENDVAEFVVLVTDVSDKYFAGIVISSSIDDYEVGHSCKNWVKDLYLEEGNSTWQVISKKQFEKMLLVGL